VGQSTLDGPDHNAKVGGTRPVALSMGVRERYYMGATAFRSIPNGLQHNNQKNEGKFECNREQARKGGRGEKQEI